MTRFLSLAAAGLILAGLAAAPASAEHWRGGGDGYHGHHRWGGWDRPRWGGHGHGWGRPAYAHRPHWGPRCRTVVMTRWSNWRGGYVQRPVEMCG